MRIIQQSNARNLKKSTEQKKMNICMCFQEVMLDFEGKKKTSFDEILNHK